VSVLFSLYCFILEKKKQLTFLDVSPRHLDT